MHVQLNIEALSLHHCSSRKATSIIYSECVSVALGIRHAMRMLRKIFSSMVCLFLPHVSILSHIEHKFSVLIFSEVFVEISLILRRTKRGAGHKYT